MGACKPSKNDYLYHLGWSRILSNDREIELVNKFLKSNKNVIIESIIFILIFSNLNQLFAYIGLSIWVGVIMLFLESCQNFLGL